MTPADHHTLAKKLEYLRKQLDTLKPYRTLSEEVLRTDLEKRLIVERLPELSIQSVIDISRLLVTLEDWRPIRDERDALLILAHKKVIGAELANHLLKAKGFRNILVHEYAEIDLGLLLAHLHEGVDDLEAFAVSLAEWLSEQGK